MDEHDEDVGGETPPPPRRDDLQFSLGELLLLMAGASCFMSLLGYFPGGYTAANFAGLTGLGVLAALLIIAFVSPVRAIVNVGLWAMLILYLLACGVALWKG